MHRPDALQPTQKKPKIENRFPLLSLRKFIIETPYFIIAILIIALFGLMPHLSRIISMGTDSAIIAINLSYAPDSSYDTDNDGIEYFKGVIDLTVSKSAFAIPLNESYLATRYQIISQDTNQSSIICYGAEPACSFVELLPASPNWNDTFYLYYGKDSATFNTLILAQIIYARTNDSTISDSEIYYSSWENRSITFRKYIPPEISSVHHVVSCSECYQQQVYETEAVNLSVHINGTIFEEPLMMYYPADWDILEPAFDETESVNETHRKITTTLYDISDVAVVHYRFKAPRFVNESVEETPRKNNHSFAYAISNFSESFSLTVADINESENATPPLFNNPPQCNFPNVTLYGGENLSLNLKNYCTDNDGDVLKYGVHEHTDTSLNLDEGVLTIVPLMEQSNSFEIKLTISDGIHTLNQSLFVFIVSKNTPALWCTDLPNITGEKNRIFTLNLSNYCTDTLSKNLSYTAFQTDNIVITIDQHIASFIPSENFTGTAYTFFIANNSEQNTITNVIALYVIENQQQEQTIPILTEVGKPVRWRKTVSLNVSRENLSITIPSYGFNISIQKKEPAGFEKIADEKVKVRHGKQEFNLQEFNEVNVAVDAASKKLLQKKESEKQTEFTGSVGLQAAFVSEIEPFGIDTESDTEILLNDTTAQIIVEYETEAPHKEEEIISQTKKRIKISSELHYENVIAKTAIPEISSTAEVRSTVYWLVNDSAVIINTIAYEDSDGNGLPDTVRWIVPHLSNQTFEIEITILDVKSYPVVGGIWTVRFNTSGTANLSISAVDGTTYTEKEIDDVQTNNDLHIFELTCGNVTLFNYDTGINHQDAYLITDTSEKIKISDTLNQTRGIASLFFENYNCENETSVWNVKVVTAGSHVQKFTFGNITAYAHNYALSGYIFTDNTDTDFGQGTFFNTRFEGSGSNSNVTLNYTTNYTNAPTFYVYNTTGNFTSQTFDSKQNHTVFGTIAWDKTLTNSSDILAIAMDSGARDVGAFYRNGSIGINTNIRTYDTAIPFTTIIRGYTIPPGWSYDDIVGIGWDDDGAPNVVALFRNGSTATNSGQADLTTDVDFTAVSTYTLPTGFNASKIIGFAIDTGQPAAAVFFGNGSFIVAGNEAPAYNFNVVRSFTMPPVFDPNSTDVVGVDFSDFGSDVAMFFRNGSYVADTSQADFSTNIDFLNVFTHSHTGGINTTTSTNITLYTRVSNDTSTWTDWQGPYTNSENQSIINGTGRYIQYRARFFTPDRYITPILENVSINYTLDTFPPQFNISINNTYPRRLDTINFTVNLSDSSGLSYCRFVDNMSATGALRHLNKSVWNIGDQCSQNYTISLPRGAIINFTVFVNDTYNNTNQSSLLIEIANTPPPLAQILLPVNNSKTNKQPLPLNVTFPADIDDEQLNITYYINGTLNQTTPYNTTLNASDGIYTLSVSLWDGYSNSSNVSINFTLDTEFPVVNGSLNKTQTAIKIYDVINASFNATDIVGLGFGQITINDSGITKYYNFSLDDVQSKEFSQNLSIGCGRGCIVNITGIVNDSAGNYQQNSTIINISNTPPQPPIVVYPPDDYKTNRQPLDINITVIDFDFDALSFYYFVNGLFNQTSLTNTTLNASDGIYIINISAYDDVGFSTNTTINITLDTTAPSISLIYPLNSSFNSSGLLQMNYLPTDLYLDRCMLYTNFTGLWEINQTTMNPQSQIINQFNTTQIPDGVYIWNVYCNDTAGNIGYNATNYTISVDTGAPSINFTYPTPQNNTNLSQGTQIFNVTHLERNPDTLIFSLNGSLQNQSMPYSNEPNYTNLTKTNLHGTYEFYYWANDSAGNTNQTEIRTVNIDTKNPQISIMSPGNNTWNNTINITFYYTVSDNFLGTKNCTLFFNNRQNQTNTTIIENTEQFFNITLNNTHGINWSINCTDYVENTNVTETYILKIDTTFPTILNVSINKTEINVTEKICLNATVNDTYSSLQFVYAELDLPESTNINITLTNDTLNPNSCAGFGGNVWSFGYVATEMGETNWTTTYAQDFAGNLNATKTFGLNWSQTAAIFLNSTLLTPLLNFEINESDLETNYTFTMQCNATCRLDSTLDCAGVRINPQYYNDSWHDITNFSSQLISNQMNKTCGNIPKGEHCNATFSIRSSVISGNNNFSVRCRAKGASTPNDYSELFPNATINDHPAAVFTYPSDTFNVNHLRGIVILNGSDSSDDQNISNYTFELDDTTLFSSPKTLCSSNKSNCTFDTQNLLIQNQCQEDTPDCYLRLNITDNDHLQNSTIIQIQIDNTAPKIRLDAPANNTYLLTSLVEFNYTAFDTNLSTCSLYHNETGNFVINETNATVKNNTLDTFTITLLDRQIVWNIGCNDTAGNLAFNTTNFTLTIDTQNPRINFTFPTLPNNSYAAQDYIVINASVNDTNFANITFYLYNSLLQLINETNFTTQTFFLNISQLTDKDEIYYYNVTVRDKAGRQNSTETRQITLDNTYPQLNYTGPTRSNNTYLNQNYILINVTTSDTNFANATFYLYNSIFTLINETNFTSQNVLNPDNLTLNISNLADLNERYYYNVTLRDKAGLVNTTETREIILDNTTPIIQLISPINNTLTKNSSINFTYYLTETNIKNCTLYANFSGEFKQNLSDPVPTPGTINNLTVQNISDGYYIWNIRCFDLAENNAFNGTNYTLDIDTTPPTSFNLELPLNNTESINRSPLLNWTVVNDSHFQNYTVLVDNNLDFSSIDFVYKLSGNASNNTLFVPDQWTGNTAWYWKVIAWDTLNHSTNSTDYYWYIIDNMTPQITLVDPDNYSVQNTTEVSFKFNVTDINTITNCTLLINEQPRYTSNSIIKNTTTSITISLANGDYNWSVNCTDRAGNLNNSVFHNLTVNSAPLIPTTFVDTTQDDFGAGIIHLTNITGSGNPANVTLNITEPLYIGHPTTGNFTSRIFDTGATSTQMLFIAWSILNFNSSDVLGHVYDDSSSTFAVFYRNGSFGVDTSQADLASEIDVNGALRSWTLPGGIDSSDIIGVDMDPDGTPDGVYLFHINGSTIGATGIATLDGDITFSLFSTWTIPAGFNATDIIDFAIDSSSTDSAAFFKNGSYASNRGQEVPPFTFNEVWSFTVLAGYEMNTSIGVAMNRVNTEDDLAIFFQNGSFLFDTSVSSFIEAVTFSAESNISYQPDANLTELTNITLHTRASNNSQTFTDWTLAYNESKGSKIETTTARYIQYQARFFTPDKFITPILENVSVNYTELTTPRINFTNPTPANDSYLNFDFILINVSIYDEHSISRCVLEFNGVNETMPLIRDGRNASCYVNKTTLAEGKYGFKVYANDTFGNRNATEDRNITIDLTPPSFTEIFIAPNPANYTFNNVSVNYTITELYINETEINVSYPNRTTFSAFRNENFTLTTLNLSVPGNYSIHISANDTAGNNNSRTDYLFVRDVVPPTISLISPANKTTNNGSIDFIYLPNDDYNISNCTLILNGKLNISNDSIQLGIPNNISINLSEGAYDWNINCTDWYNNTNNSEIRRLIIDLSPPQITLNYPVYDFNTSVDYFNFNWTPSDNFDSNISCNLTINSIVIAVNVTNLTTRHMNMTIVNLSEGSNYWNVSCIDYANNSNYSETRNFTIVKGPPAVNITLSGDNESINLTWDAQAYADNYSIYFMDNFNDEFGPLPNATVTHPNFTDYTAGNISTRFYKIAGVRGGVNKTTIATFGKYEFELVNNSNEPSDWVLLSLPLNITNFLLYNNSNEGLDMRVKPLQCIKSLWFYNATIQKFKRTDYNGSDWIRVSGSENFTSLEMGRGYWAEINQTCNLTFVGVVPVSNVTVPLETGWNLVGWFSPNGSNLPMTSAPDWLPPEPPYYPMNLNVTGAVKAIDRYNPATDRFEVTIHFDDGWGWWPSWNNGDFTALDPTRGYYLDNNESSRWYHEPNTRK